MKSKFAKAVETVTNGIKNDAELKEGYRANIAMAFKDEMENKGVHSPNEDNHSILVTRDMLHKIANDAAENFLNLWIK